MVAIDGLRDDVRVGRASLPSSTDSQERLQTMSDRRDEIIEVAKEVCRGRATTTKVKEDNRRR